MATRFYLTETAFTVVNPGTIGTWGSTTNKAIKKMTTPNPGDTSFITYNVSMNGAFTSLHRQYISEPMAAGISFTTSSTYTMVAQQQESSTAADSYMRYHLAIVSEDGATIRCQFSAGEKEGTENPTSYASRTNVNTGGLGNYTTVAGDRLVLEYGVDKDASGTYTISYRYGNTGASDLSSTEGDTGSTDNPWFETSVNITFDVEDPPPAENEDFDCTTYISAVLDEWV